MRPPMRRNALSVPSFLAVQEILSNPNDHCMLLIRNRLEKPAYGYAKTECLTGFDITLSPLCAGTRCRARLGRALAEDSGTRSRVHRVCGRGNEFMGAAHRC